MGLKRLYSALEIESAPPPLMMLEAAPSILPAERLLTPHTADLALIAFHANPVAAAARPLKGTAEVAR